MKIQKLTGHPPSCIVQAHSTSFVTNDFLIGLELEVEDCPLERHEFFFWTQKVDPSLRGDHRNELILREPLIGQGLTEALEELRTFFSTPDLPYTFSHRTSLHVHVDMRTLTFEELYKIVCIYMIFEHMLFTYVDTRYSLDRENNIYCVPLYKTLAIRNVLQDIYTKYELVNACTYDNGAAFMMQNFNQFHKYSALNVSSLFTFGSLEFRQHPGTINIPDIVSWINIILKITQYAVDSSVALKDLPAHVSRRGLISFANDVFQDTRLLGYLDLDKMLDGIRYAQDVIYGGSTMQARGELLLSEYNKPLKRRRVK